MNLLSWMEWFARTYGYLGAFIVSIFGNLTIVFPIPYTTMIYMLGSILNPILLGLACGAGSTIGEMSAYLVGFGGKKLLEKRYGERLEAARTLFERFGAVIIFVFALLPLPDDLILIPLGMMGYSLKTVVVACFLGKTVMGIIVAVSGKLSYEIVSRVFGGGGLWATVATAILLAVFVYATVKVDWVKYLEVFARKRRGTEKRGDSLRLLEEAPGLATTTSRVWSSALPRPFRSL